MFRILLITAIFLISSFSAFANSKAFYIRTAHPPTHFVVTDPLGRKTGFNPITNIHYQEAPNQSYGEDNFSGDDVDTSYLYAINDRNGEVLDGIYKIMIIGQSEYLFLTVDYPHPLAKGNYAQVQTMTYTQKIDYYEFNYNYEQASKGVPLQLIRIVTPSILMDDIKLLEKQHFLRNNAFAAELIQDILKIEEYKDLNIKKAKYKEFIQKLTRKYNKSEKDIYVTSIALGMLQRDVEYIINHIQ